MKCIIISIFKVKKLALKKSNNLLKVKEVNYPADCFPTVKLETFLFSFQQALENKDFFHY